MARARFIRWFCDITMADVALVGGKNASLGEMCRELIPRGISVPNGFAITAEGYRHVLHVGGLAHTIQTILSDLNTADLTNLAARGRRVREAIFATPLPIDLQQEIAEVYITACDEHGSETDVAVRSSATAEDLPDASFAGQQESFLNIRSERALLDACQQCLASLFTDRAISYCVDKDVIVRLSDFKTNEYVGLLGSAGFEPQEENPMIGFRGASRYYDPRYREGFLLECRAMKKVREEMGLTNVKLMISFCRTVEEGQKVLAVMAEAGLQRGHNELEIYVMCEIPANVILTEEFATIFDGFSIGSNDLTQLTLGLDRDSAIVAHLFDERDAAVMHLVKDVIQRAQACDRKVGICGQAPSDYLEFARFLVTCGIDSISLNPDTVIKTTQDIVEMEQQLVKKKEAAA